METNELVFSKLLCKSKIVTCCRFFIEHKALTTARTIEQINLLRLSIRQYDPPLDVLLWRIRLVERRRISGLEIKVLNISGTQLRSIGRGDWSKIQS